MGGAAIDGLLREHGWRVERLSGALGARVLGVELRSIESAAVEAIEAMLLVHRVLFFPDQTLTVREHRDLGARFGDLMVHPYLPVAAPEEALEVIELRSSVGHVADTWHTDLSFTERPAKMSILQAVAVPDAGGDTIWSSQVAAYQGLSPRIQSLLCGLDITNRSDVDPSLAAEHPAVHRHPDTGELALFINEGHTKSIHGLSTSESGAVLDLLARHSTQPRFAVRHRWSVGTVAMWDNRCTQHYVVNDFVGDRIMRRVTVEGARPIPA